MPIIHPTGPTGPTGPIGPTGPSSGAQCPVCHSYLNATGSNDSDDPKWMDDPIKTPRGLAGPDYQGIQHMKHYHWIQLQDYYTYLRDRAGLDSVDFSTIDDTVDINHYHVEELRQTVEDLLKVSGLTIADYFKSDKYGDTLSSTQTDWTDVDRAKEGFIGKPILPRDVSVKAIHIEELRRGLTFGFPVMFSSSNEWDLQGLGKIGTTGALFYKDFMPVELSSSDENPQPGVFIGNTLNNVREWLTVQNGVVHKFTCLNADEWYSQMVYSFAPVGELDNWSYPPTPVVFDPPIEIPIDSYETQGYRSVSIDESDPHDYIMYTVELFKERVSGLPSDVGNNLYNFPNYIAKYRSPKVRQLGTSTGSPLQSFSYSDTIVEGSDTILVGTQTWTRVDDFNSSTASSHVYTIDYDDQIIYFGDGVHGAIPPADTEVSLQLSLTGGGGTWTFDSIVKQFDHGTNVFYWSVIACHGKLWYQTVNDFLWDAIATPGTTAALITGKTIPYYADPGHLKYRDELRFFVGGPGEGQGNEGSVTLTGSFSVQTFGPAAPFVGGYVWPYQGPTQHPMYGGWTDQPKVDSDSPGGYSVTWGDVTNYPYMPTYNLYVNGEFLYEPDTGTGAASGGWDSLTEYNTYAVMDTTDPLHPYWRSVTMSDLRLQGQPSSDYLLSIGDKSRSYSENGDDWGEWKEWELIYYWHDSDSGHTDYTQRTGQHYYGMNPPPPVHHGHMGGYASRDDIYVPTGLYDTRKGDLDITDYTIWGILALDSPWNAFYRQVSTHTTNLHSQVPLSMTCYLSGYSDWLTGATVSARSHTINLTIEEL